MGRQGGPALAVQLVVAEDSSPPSLSLPSPFLYPRLGLPLPSPCRHPFSEGP